MTPPQDGPQSDAAQVMSQGLAGTQVLTEAESSQDGGSKHALEVEEGGEVCLLKMNGTAQRQNDVIASISCDLCRSEAI